MGWTSPFGHSGNTPRSVTPFEKGQPFPARRAKDQVAEPAYRVVDVLEHNVFWL